jgi:hypothetical protein
VLHTCLEAHMQVRGEPPSRLEVIQEVRQGRRAKLSRLDITTKVRFAAEQALKVPVVLDTARPIMR